MTEKLVVMESNAKLRWNFSTVDFLSSGDAWRSLWKVGLTPSSSTGRGFGGWNGNVYLRLCQTGGLTENDEQANSHGVTSGKKKVRKFSQSSCLNCSKWLTVWIWLSRRRKWLTPFMCVHTDISSMLKRKKKTSVTLPLSLITPVTSSPQTVGDGTATCAT